jgi:hypothetical protein
MTGWHWLGRCVAVLAVEAAALSVFGGGPVDA